MKKWVLLCIWHLNYYLIGTFSEYKFIVIICNHFFNMMSIEAYLDGMKGIEADLLAFLEEGEENTESNFQNLKDRFDKI